MLGQNKRSDSAQPTPDPTTPPVGDGAADNPQGGALARRTTRNALFSFLSFVQPTVLTVLVTPVIVHGLGAESYGILSLSAVLVSFVALLDLGMSPSLLKFVSEYRARDDFDGINKVLGASIMFYVVVGLVGGLATFVVGQFFVTDLFNISPEALSLAQFAFSAAAITFLIAMPINPLGAFPASLQRWGISTAVSMGWSTASGVAGVIVVSLGYGLRPLVVVNALITAVVLVVVAVVDRKLLPEFRPIFRVDPGLLKKIFSFSSIILVGNISGVVLFQLDKVLIGSIVSVALVTYYVIPGMIAQRLQSACASLSAVLLPVASDLLARGEHQRVAAMYRRAVRFVTLLVVTVGIPAIIYSGKILHYWLGPEFETKSTTVLRLLIVTYAVLSLGAVPYYIAVGAGRPWITALSSLAAAILNVGLIAFLIPWFGIVGAAVAYLLSTAPTVGFIWYTERKILRLRERLWPGLIVRLLVPAAVQSLVGFLALPLATNLGTLLLVLGAVILVCPLTYYLCGFLDAEDRELFLSLVSRKRHAVDGQST